MFLDGIRHAADMAGVAHDRLWDKLCFLDSDEEVVSTSADIAEAGLFAWSIIDAAHRISDLTKNLPGLPHSPWRRVFANRMAEAEEFRNDWQHQLGDTGRIVEERGQMWGALAWHKHYDNRPSGRWHLAVIGSDLKGSRWFPCGPSKAIPRVDSRRIRLLHCNREIYLTRLVRDVFEGIHDLENDLTNGKLVLRGECVNQPREKDWVMEMMMQVLVGTKKPPDPDGEIAEGVNAAS